MIDPFHIDIEKLKAAIRAEHQKYLELAKQGRFVFPDQTRRTDLYRLRAHLRGRLHMTHWDKVGSPWHKEIKAYFWEGQCHHMQPRYTNMITYKHVIFTLEQQEKFISKELVQEFWLETPRQPFVQAREVDVQKTPHLMVEDEVQVEQQVRVGIR